MGPASGVAESPERLVNDLISGLGRWSCDQPTLAPPALWSSPTRGYKTAPCPWCFPPAGFPLGCAAGAGYQTRSGEGGGNREQELEGRGWAGFLGKYPAGAWAVRETRRGAGGGGAWGGGVPSANSNQIPCFPKRYCSLGFGSFLSLPGRIERKYNAFSFLVVTPCNLTSSHGPPEASAVPILCPCA